jgi:transposase-like protein
MIICCYVNENKYAIRSHSNGIESFWDYVKTRLVKFKGMDKKYVQSTIKECEFRFNHKGKNMYKTLLKLFRNQPLKFS